ncbi:MAG: cation-translocating P-type ATPase [Deltaproteobacteria bacterium]|nr:cation-translocating P-type ATPase [Deltaproteobacteria bacterium]
MGRAGLTSQEARSRLATYGPNELAADRGRSFWATMLGIVREPMFILLLAAGALYIVLGDLQEALALLVAVVGIITMTLFQQRKTERAVSRLRELAAPHARVVRDGRSAVVPARDVVPGDLVMLAEGDRVPADGWVLDGTNLRADESLLTGESVPVDKLPRAGDDAPLGPFPAPGEPGPATYAGTLVVRGQGLSEVVATGARSAMGRIGQALARTVAGKTLLEREVGRLVSIIALVGGALCVVVFMVQGLVSNDWIAGLLAGITLAMALLPEEMPVVLMVFTTLGAYRISRFGVLARRPETIETLGAATILCVDKTGTITENRMRIARLETIDAASVAVPRGEDPVPLPEAVHRLLELGILASPRDPSDPMERAFEALGARAIWETEHLHPDWEHEADYPLTRDILAVTHVWRRPEGVIRIAAAKGSPEAIADLCHLDAARLGAVLARAQAMADAGLRVLAVAEATLAEGAPLPGGQHDLPFALVGLVGLEDPVRASVPAAVREFHAAGVRVVMITGDHAGTARAIAAQAGIPVRRVLTGPELDALDDAALSAIIGEVDVFARAVPDHKLRLVRALQARGEIVGMTGDGVNDAPALKAANIGIAMGQRGTDVAREAAALVLTHEDFGAVGQAIVLGRRIYQNLRKALTYLIAVHVPIALMALLPILFGLEQMLLPVHVLFLELVIDPASTIALEAEAGDPRHARLPPRRGDEPLFGRRAVLTALLQGLVMLAAAAAVYFVAVLNDKPLDEARTLAFVTMVLGNVFLIQVERSERRTALGMLLGSKNTAAVLVLALALAALALVLAVPGLRDVFHFTLPSAGALVVAALAGLGSALWFDAVKLWRARSAADAAPLDRAGRAA